MSETPGFEEFGNYPLEFDNPAHTSELRMRQMLPYESSSITVREFVENALKKKNLEPVLLVLQQEVRTYHANFNGIDVFLSSAEAAVNQITDENSFAKAFEVSERAVTVLTRANEQTTAIYYCVHEIENRLQEKEQRERDALLTPTAKHYIRTIGETFQELGEDVEGQLPDLLERIKHIEEKLDAWNPNKS